MKKKDVIAYLRRVAKQRRATHQKLPRDEKSEDWWNSVSAYGCLEDAAKSLETNGRKNHG